MLTLLGKFLASFFISAFLSRRPAGFFSKSIFLPPAGSEPPIYGFDGLFTCCIIALDALATAAIGAKLMSLFFFANFRADVFSSQVSRQEIST